MTIWSYVVAEIGLSTFQNVAPPLAYSSILVYFLFHFKLFNFLIFYLLFYFFFFLFFFFSDWSRFYMGLAA